MRGGDDSFLPALASGASIELASQKAIALVGHGPCRLHQSAAQPAVPLVGPAASSFGPALVVTGSQTSPTGGVRRVWERRHIRTHLSHDRPGNYPLESRDAHQTFMAPAYGFIRSAISVSSRTILRAHGVRFLAVSQNIDTDQSNTTSRLMLHILAAVSEFSDPTMARIAIHHYAY